MEEPPLMMDGTRVVEYAIFDPAVAPTHHVSAIQGGVPLDLSVVRGLAIAESLVEEGVFLLHCNDRWETVTAGHYPDRDAAKASAQKAYSGVAMQWSPFRSLTPAEAAEVETTRAFLRELAADNPNE